MKKKNKLILLSSILFCLFSVLFLTSYAFFNYSENTNELVIKAGDINMYLTSDNQITLDKIFPETLKEARSKTDNYIDFSISTNNEYKNPVYYEIILNYGDDQDGKTRILDKYLRYELYYVTTSGAEVLVYNENSTSIDSKSIYVNKFDTNSTVTTRTYRLRVWIDKDLKIGNTDSCNYTADEWNNLFASVKVTVIGDLTAREIYNINVLSDLSAFSSYNDKIKEVYFLNEEQSLIDNSYNLASIKADVTLTSYSFGSARLKEMTDYGKVLAWLEAIDETYYKLYVAADGLIYLSDANSLFYKYTVMEICDVSNVRTDFVTRFGFAFYNCYKLESLDVSKWSTSNGNSFGCFFSNCNSLTTLDVSNFDTSNCTNFAYCFFGCYSLTLLDVSKWDTSNVENMNRVFLYCSSVTIIDVSKWDTSKVTDMQSMFNRCSGISTIDLSNFKTSKVTDMNNMFYNCSNLTTIDVSSFDTSKCTNMSCMFESCSKLETINLSNFDTSKVTDMSLMFKNCTKLNALEISNFDTSKVTNMSSMFLGCSTITLLNLGSFNTSIVTNMNSMFSSCSKLTTIKVGSNWNIDAVTDSENMFLNDGLLKGGNGFRYDAGYLDKTYALINTSTVDGYLTEA